jgi:hypothetical protein
MRLKIARVVLAIVGLTAAGPVNAHHSVPVNFDQTREISIEGTLTQILWVNPHAHFRLDVTSPDGTKVEWLVEMGASNTMKRAGFPMDRFAVGDRITVIGAPGRRDRTVLLEETVLKDGTRLTPTMRPRTPGNREAQ